MVRRTAFALLLISLIAGCKQDDDPIVIIDGEDKTVVELEGAVVRDSTHKLLLYNGTLENLPEKIKIGQDTLVVSETPSDFAKGKAYSGILNGEIYTLYKTELPIISVNTDSREIVDEPKILGNLQLWEKGEKTFESIIGIEIRGGFSQTFPKKSYSVELWEDEAGEESYSESLLGLCEDDDWILDGLWNEPLHLR